MYARWCFLLALVLGAWSIVPAQAQTRVIQEFDPLVDETENDERGYIFETEYETQRVYTRLEATWLQRLKADNLTILQIFDEAFNRVGFVETNGIDYRLRPGMRLVVGGNVNAQGKLEASFYGLNEWTEYQNVLLEDTESSASPYLQFGLTFDLDGDGDGAGPQILYNSTIPKFSIAIAR